MVAELSSRHANARVHVCWWGGGLLWLRIILALLIAGASGASTFAAQASVNASQESQPRPQQNLEILVTVVDENGVAVSSVRLTLEPVDRRSVQQGVTDAVGRCKFKNLEAGAYSLHAQKEGFYTVNLAEVRAGETQSVEVVLNHQQEYAESVNVAYTPPAIDPVKTTSSESLNTREIIDLPYTVPRDIRYALPLLPGVLQDAYGQIHVDGSSTRQVFDQLDGFNITDPVNGLFNMRVSVDALRSVNVQSSRYPVEYGKGSGGILSLTTGMGDDRFRYSGTDFLPSLGTRKGLHVNTWTPRGAVSGPIRKGKAWFVDALDGEYDLNVVNELPPGADRSWVWRYSNLAKTQVNLTPSNILTGSFLVNQFYAKNSGLTQFNPLETTVNLNDTSYLVDVKDLAYFSSGALLETGVAFSRFRDTLRPQGNLPYVITPESTRGNYFESAEDHSSRFQGIANLFLHPVQWNGRHEFKLGTDVDRIDYDQSFDRRSYSILREDGTLSRLVTFVGNPAFSRNNVELSGYLQDRWSISDRLLVEPGLRLDWDQIARGVRPSPRLAWSYMLTADGNTKLVAGIGIYYDASNLQLITSPLTGQRVDFFYDSTGQTLAFPPVTTAFQVDARNLREPRFLNWSAGVERKLAASTYLRVEFVEKRGHNGWAFINQGTGQPGVLSGIFTLENFRQDQYDALGVTLRRSFQSGRNFFASYTRSAARSNAVLNFNLDNPLFSQQAGGPLPWDTPNRFVSWGILPFWKGCALAYTTDWHDGFPFALVNQTQELVGTPGARRFPTYFSLNVAVEKRVRAMGFQWQLRVGFDNVTNRHNPNAVNNNVDSPQFLTFSSLEGRSLTAQLRLLGKK
jgi:hypothetical protein